MDPYSRELSPLYSPLVPWPCTVCFTQSPGGRQTFVTACNSVFCRLTAQCSNLHVHSYIFSYILSPGHRCKATMWCNSAFSFICLSDMRHSGLNDPDKVYITNVCPSLLVHRHLKREMQQIEAQADVPKTWCFSLSVLLMYNWAEKSNSCLERSLAWSPLLRAPANISTS